MGSSRPAGNRGTPDGRAVSLDGDRPAVACPNGCRLIHPGWDPERRVRVLRSVHDPGPEHSQERRPGRDHCRDDGPFPGFNPQQVRTSIRKRGAVYRRMVEATARGTFRVGQARSVGMVRVARWPVARAACGRDARPLPVARMACDRFHAFSVARSIAADGRSGHAWGRSRAAGPRRPGPARPSGVR
jgi:hypothetical protein